MQTKTCTKCGVEYDLEHFNKKGSGRATRCRACVAQYYREYYQSNADRREYIKSRTRANARIAKEKAIAIVLEAFKTGCVDCGEKDIRVLEFDHRGDKEFNVSILINRNSIEKLKKEIAKCEVVCANHHRIRTAAQFDTWRNAAVYPLADNE